MSKKTQNINQIKKMLRHYVNDYGVKYFDLYAEEYDLLKKTLFNKEFVKNLNDETFKKTLKKFGNFGASGNRSYDFLLRVFDERKEELYALLNALQSRAENFVPFVANSLVPLNVLRSLIGYRYENLFLAKQPVKSLGFSIRNLQVVEYNQIKEAVLSDKNIRKASEKLPEHFLVFDFFEWMRTNYNMVNLKDVKEIKIQNHFSIKDISINKTDSNEIYFLGENGVGKTILLQAVYLSYEFHFINTNKNISKLSEAYNITTRSGSTESSYSISPDFKFEGLGRKNIFAYGVNRTKVSKDTDDYEFMTLFSDNYELRSPVQWLTGLYNQENEEKLNPEKAVPHISLEDAKKMLIELLEKQVSIEVSSKEVIFKEKKAPVRFEQLSDGYKSVLAWVCDLLSRMGEQQPWVEEIQEFEGIVLIDELDMFLHPKWAYKIMNQVRSWFPKVRFIISTHSPILILGANKDAIFYKVYKEDGESKISEPYQFKDFLNLTSNALITAPFIFDLDFAGTREMKDEDFYKESLDTSGHYNIYKIYKEVEKRVKQKRRESLIISEKDIEKIVSEAIEALEHYDKNQ